ncbi:MAG: YbhB/YbcL family Raf kinase inhibitor-like protein [Proteobacteria bacterium]|nr:YbhB/YbcL family Raf kinase inhibitor-like protein [Pseudomonadota bacterium]
MRRSAPIISGGRIVLAFAAALAASPLAWASGRAGSAPPPRQGAGDARLSLRSPGLASGDAIPLSDVYDRYGCHGGNTSPALLWSHPPAGTRSFALLMYDSDAPGGWWHWALFDIPAGVSSLPAGAGDPARHLLPAGSIQLRNDFGSLGYGGPCPPPGPPHHYHLTLYALRLAKLGLDAGANPAQVAARARAAALAQAQIVGLYGR